MEKKLLLFDLDDTLLTSEKTITPLTVEAIKACKAKGMIIGYITARARPFYNEIFFTDAYNLPCDFIAYNNGAEICAEDASSSSIEENVIPYEHAMKIIFGINETYPNAKIGIRFGPWSYYMGENWNINTGEKVKCTIFELPHYDVQRIRIVFDKNDDIQLNDFMTENTIFFVTSDGTAMILNKNATKEHAVQKASEYFTIPLSDVIAFGDDINDINMLKTAGISVAMGNAREPVKEIADFVTETNDNEGVSVWINKYLLRKLIL
ncbi:MAG: HAD-IIB family hydrolase [Oscillospiraceae bacterium]|nr:HAD-IIB family hydrolase [Oscillospiraceae bacterium]